MHSAKTSAVNDYDLFTFTTGGTFVINNPEQGLMRITASGDWTNAGPISADVSIFGTSAALPQFSAQGKTADLLIGFEIHTATDKFELRVGLDGKVVKIK